MNLFTGNNRFTMHQSEIPAPGFVERLDRELRKSHKPYPFVDESRSITQTIKPTRVAMMKEEFTELTFEELQNIEKEVGFKHYKKTVLKDCNTDSDDDNDDANTFTLKAGRPEEVSSKIRKKKIKKVVPVTKKVRRDPRFDDLSGRLNQEQFEKSYEFINPLRAAELKEVVKQAKIEKNVHKKEELLTLQKRMQNQQSERQRQKEANEERSLRKKNELKMINEGKNPFYLKKSEIKKNELRKKFTKLKEEGGLEKYLSKKRKRTASKQKRLLPDKRE